ncbi:MULTISPECIES: hypothetical protein [unclassified Roseivivax]|uniref:hypothetical protein n=1 Tax=Roseivivax sp. GX 12232 TaxID=2900547 RepID=UPI001E5F17CF|nr:hypothetical protein [Roseivivax sp. GX 12232]MCE0506078.1 hypothetical protein [Roseivivax sp. GX 12232]
MAQVTRLAPEEPARLDTETLVRFCAARDPQGAEEAVCRAMEALARGLAEAERAWSRQDWTALDQAAARVAVHARATGMTGLLRSAGDIRACLAAGDAVALAATLARLLRVGERSLYALWNHDAATV